MPVYLFTTPEGDRLVSAHSKKAAYDHVVSGLITCNTASPNVIADAIKSGISMEFAPDLAAPVDVGVTDIEDHPGNQAADDYAMSRAQYSDDVQSALDKADAALKAA